MAGLAPMMFGLSVNFVAGGFTLDAPTSLWWKQLATAVVFGLGLATVLTLIVTPALLSVRVWAEKGAYGAAVRAAAVFRSRASDMRRDLLLGRATRRAPARDIIWDEEEAPIPRRIQLVSHPGQAAE